MAVNAYVSNWEAKATGLEALDARQIQEQPRLYETLSQENNNNEYMNTVSLTKKEKLKILKNIR